MNRFGAVSWYGFRAWTLDNEALRIVTVPRLGGKVVSLFDKRTGLEWLASPPQPPASSIPYGAKFCEFSLYGWDEMFPTIQVCAYPGPGVCSGVSLPDHGEVWTLPWDTVEANALHIILSVVGVTLPYQLTRTLTVDHATLQMEYQLSNQSDQPLPYLWAAHPLFVGNSAIEIILPEEVTQLYNVQSSKLWGKPGCRYNWPRAQAQNGQTWRLNRVGHPSQNDARKFYVPPEVQAVWAALFDHNSGSWLRLAWSSNKLPYLGIWVDEGRYTPETTIALEPATGFYDSLALAWENKQLSILPPMSDHDWHLTIELGAGGDVVPINNAATANQSV